MGRKGFDDLLTQQLSERGKEASLAIFSEQERLINIRPTSNYFAVAIATAFTWTGHAVRHDDFVDLAIHYLSTGDLACLSGTREFSGRFGPKGLNDGLRAWKATLDQVSNVSEEIKSCNAEKLYTIQDRILSEMTLLLDRRQIFGVGPWLFCAPFKIIAAHRRDLWESESLDNVWMPLGLEVVRAIRKLIQQRYIYFRGFDANMLSEEEGGLKEGLGTVLLVQARSKEIAQSAKTRVLHINSGLYLYGRDEL